MKESLLLFKFTAFGKWMRSEKGEIFWKKAHKRNVLTLSVPPHWPDATAC